MARRDARVHGEAVVVVEQRAATRSAGKCARRSSANRFWNPGVASPVAASRDGTAQRAQGLIACTSTPPTRSALPYNASSQNASTPSISMLARKRRRAASTSSPNQPATAATDAAETSVGPGRVEIVGKADVCVLGPGERLHPECRRMPRQSRCPARGARRSCRRSSTSRRSTGRSARSIRWMFGKFLPLTNRATRVRAAPSGDRTRAPPTAARGPT